ncbi:hypothetical protein ACFV23_52830 [Streptomyces sp. NPDC059627]
MPETTLPDTEAREVLGADGAVFDPLVHNPRNGVTGGVWRVRAGHRSAVLKVLTRGKAATGGWAASNEPRHWNYWRREAYVYESGLARAWQPYGIRAPRLLARVERLDGDIALWLEDVPGEPATAWPLARHVEHARRLGAAQGAVRTGDHPWLTRRLLRPDKGRNTRGPERLVDDEARLAPREREH